MTERTKHLLGWLAVIAFIAALFILDGLIGGPHP